MKLSFLTAAEGAAEFEVITGQIQTQQSQLETTALIIGLILVTVIILITWQTVRWVDRRGLGRATMIAAGALTPVVIFVSFFSLIVGPAEMLNSLVGGKMQPILVASGFFAIGPVVTWVALRKRKQRLRQSFETFE